MNSSNQINSINDDKERIEGFCSTQNDDEEIINKPKKACIMRIKRKEKKQYKN